MQLSNIDFFANEYNEENWKRFSSCFNKSSEITKFRNAVPEDVMNALIGLLGIEESIKWISRELKQLELKTATELVRTEKGSRALKAFIMRIPN